MKKDYANRLIENGEFRIGNLYEYTTIENDAIRDEEEGYMVIKEQQVETTTYVKDENSKEYVNIDTIPNYEPLMGVDSIIVKYLKTSKDVYTICTSFSSEKELFNGYDSCIEIFSMEFFNLIAKELRKKSLIHPINEDNELKWYCSEEIIYSKGKKINSKETKTLPCFVKDYKFHPEKEFRIVYFPAPINIGKIEAKLLIIPELSKYCKKIW